MQRRHLHADLETPVSAYIKLSSASPYSFLLESVEGGENWAAHSILGIGRRRSYRWQREANRTGHPADVDEREERLTGLDPLTSLAAAWRPATLDPAWETESVPDFVGGIFGFLAYDVVRGFAPLEQMPAGHVPTLPDLFFVEPDLLAVFDNRRHRLTLYSEDRAQLDRAESLLRGPLIANHSPRPFVPPEPTVNDAEFAEHVEWAKEQICAGEAIQIVLSRPFVGTAAADPVHVYRGLRTINPSPYLYIYQTPEVSIAGASPEVMVRVSEGQMIVRPIAGTRPRGSNAAEDTRLAEELLADPKERAEHIMLVDLGRNDIGRVAVPGSVAVDDFMMVERYSHVMHIVSEVSGQLAADRNAFDAVRAAFPMGTLSGAPKVRAMQLIDEQERTARGIYGGAIGYFGRRGDADFCIAIRTMVQQGDRVTVQAGAGIVADSDAERETLETRQKAEAVIRAMQWAASAQGS